MNYKDINWTDKKSNPYMKAIVYNWRDTYKCNQAIRALKFYFNHNDITEINSHYKINTWPILLDKISSKEDLISYVYDILTENLEFIPDNFFESEMEVVFSELKRELLKGNSDKNGE